MIGLPYIIPRQAEMSPEMFSPRLHAPNSDYTDLFRLLQQKNMANLCKA